MATNGQPTSWTAQIPSDIMPLDSTAFKWLLENQHQLDQVQFLDCVFRFAKNNNTPADITNNASLTMAFAQYGLELLEQDTPGNRPRLSMANEFIRKPEQLSPSNKDCFSTFQETVIKYSLELDNKKPDAKELSVFDRYMLDCFQEGVIEMVTNPKFHCEDWTGTGLIQTC